MRNRLTSVADAVAAIPSGSTVALGGSLMRRQPMAVVRELVRREVRHLSLLTWASSMATDVLVAADAVRAWEGIYVGFWWYGLAPSFRRAVESGRLTVQERSESYMTARFRAAAQGLPFLPVRAIRGVGSTERGVAEVTCPYTGQELHAVQAARPDVTVVHGYKADMFGNVAWPTHRDSDDVDLVMAAGARHLIVTVEKIVPHEELVLLPNQTYIPHVKVDAVCEAPWGAYPSSCDTVYDEDADEVRRWLAASRDADDARRWLESFVGFDGDLAALALDRAGDLKVSG